MYLTWMETGSLLAHYKGRPTTAQIPLRVTDRQTNLHPISKVKTPQLPYAFNVCGSVHLGSTYMFNSSPTGYTPYSLIYFLTTLALHVSVPVCN
jgi:hypothetical protein